MQLHLDPDQILDMVTSSLDSDKAEDVLSIPLGGKSSVADYMVIASGTSSRQVAAMAEHLEFRLKQAGVEILGIEGKTYLCIVGCLWLALSLHCSSSMAQCTSPLTYTLELVLYGTGPAVLHTCIL